MTWTPGEMARGLCRLYGEFAMWAALAGLGAVAAWAVARWIRRSLWRVLEAFGRGGAVSMALGACLLAGAVAVGGSKRDAVKDFRAEESPDGVAFSWRVDDGADVKWVRIWRRGRDGEGWTDWEPWGDAVTNGETRAVRGGFTLDRDWIYRAVYEYEEDAK